MTCNPRQQVKDNIWNVEGNTHEHCELRRLFTQRLVATTLLR